MRSPFLLSFLFFRHCAAYYDSERSVNKGNKQRAEVFKSVFDLVVSYAGLILMYPDTWPQTMKYGRSP